MLPLALAVVLAVVPRPHIVWKPIPYGPRRKAEMAAYAEKHYGIHSWRLQPKVIVEHYTGGDSFAAAWNAFAANKPDPELGELPGTCAHFVVDRDGTIYQLVPLDVMCRHTVGLNYVGHRDRERRHLGCGDPPRPRPAPCLARAHCVADVSLPHPDPQRDRPQREPLEPLPP